MAGVRAHTHTPVRIAEFAPTPESTVAYVSLYRKYRPQTFADIVGQGHVTRSLVNAITDDRLHHAYLFAGPRGTGKTSIARILAKSINCVEGPTATPCNECVQCVAITEGSSVDVIEMDMASHGGVDDARELRDRARFSPASARRKVYILDEVHMASTAAFNALLKLIEEPPSHVLFAMATTDPQKVLPTIMSRVQRLDLRRVGAVEAAGRVRDLVQREGGTIDDAAVDSVVRVGDGSLRDTESVLEQVLSYAEGGDVTDTDVIEVLGQTPFEAMAGVVDAMATGDLAGSFAAVQALLDGGTDLRQFTLDLVGHVRDLLVLVVAPDHPDLVDAVDERRAQLVAQSQRMSREVLTAAIDELAAALAEMRQGPARLALELALARVASRVDGTGAPAVPTGPLPAAMPATADDADAVTADTDDEPDDDGDDTDGTDGTDESDEFDDTDVTVDPEDATDEADDSDDPGQDPDDSEARAATDETDGTDGTDDPDEPGATDQPDESDDDLSSRANARGAQVAREGMPTPTQERPKGPEVAVDLPPDPDEAAQLELITSRWSAVMELVKAQSPRGAAMLAPAKVTRLRNRILTLSFPGNLDFHADRVASGEFDDLVLPAIEATCDVAVRLGVDLDGEPMGGGGPKPVEPTTEGVSSAARAAARATAADGAVDTITDGPGSTTPPAASSPSATPTTSNDDGEPTERSTPPRANPMADLDPAEAMDRAAAALADHLGATEVDPDDVPG